MPSPNLCQGSECPHVHRVRLEMTLDTRSVLEQKITPLLTTMQESSNILVAHSERLAAGMEKFKGLEEKVDDLDAWRHQKNGAESEGKKSAARWSFVVSLVVSMIIGILGKVWK